MTEERPTETTAPEEKVAETPTETAVVAPEGKPLSTALKYFYGVGDFGFNLMSSVETYYFVLFLTNFALFDPATAALISGIGSTVDAILGWMYGGFINSLKPFKWGRYRSWLIITSWLVPILYALEFTRLSDNTAVAATLIVIMNITSHAAWDFPYVSNVSLIPIAASNPDDRRRLASTRGMWSNASKIFFSYLCPPIAAVGATILGQANQYAFAAFVFGLCFALLYVVHFKMFKGYEKEYTKEELANYKQAHSDQGRTTFADLGRALVQNPPLIALLLADIAKWIFNFMCAGIASYYFIYVVFQPGMVATYIFISNILCVVGAYLSAPFGKLIGSTKNATVSGLIFMAVMLIIAWFIKGANMWAVVILMSLGQFGYGIIYACTTAMYSDTVVYAEWRMRKNAAGWISGLQLFPLKIGFVARGVAIPLVLGAAGWLTDYATQYNAIVKSDPTSWAAQGATLIPDSLQAGICNGFMLYPAILLLIAAVILGFCYKLTPAKLEQYHAEIAARKVAGEQND